MLRALTVAAIIGLTAGPALAQTDAVTGARPGNIPGSGQSLPLSNNASNIDPANTRSDIAPRLPDPSVATGGTPRDFLVAARNALNNNRTGEAQEALERAETRVLSRSVVPSTSQDPSRQPLVQTIGDARRALATNDRATVIALIDRAIANPESGMASQ